MSQIKEKAPGTEATVTSARKEHPQLDNTTMSAGSKEYWEYIVLSVNRLGDRERKILIAFINALAKEEAKK